MTRIAILAWNEVEQRLAGGAPAILPIGAGAKEHGFHLPMNTDELQALWLADALADKTGALVWPVLTYGHYPAFRDFSGSISLSRPLFAGLVREISLEILRWKPRRLFVLNTGISTLGPVDDAIEGLDHVTHLKIHQTPEYRAEARRAETQAFGSHADELETARMLAMAPQVVNMARAEATPAGPFEGPLTRANAP